MAVQDKFADEMLSDEELDGVAGGTRLKTYADGDELYNRGLLSAEDALRSASVRSALHKIYNNPVANQNATLIGV